MYRIVFLILNYHTLELTKKCVDLLFGLNKNELIDILIVNNSDDKTDYYKLKNIYKSTKNVIVLHNSEHKGFSSGNNYGYRYVKDIIKDISFLVVMNSDVFIEQKNFIEVLIEIYEKYGFHVLGPDIYVPKVAMHMNPMQSSILNEKDILNEKKQLEQVLLKDILKNYLYDLNIYKFYTYLKKFLLNLKEDNSYLCIQENVVLQGACLIFSEEFINENEVLFFPETFLYYEENILAAKCKKNGWKILYNPEIKVIHLAGKSSGMFCLNMKKKIRIKNKIKLESLGVYLSIIEKWGLLENENKNNNK